MSQARCHLRAALFLAAVSPRGATTGVTARRGLSAWPAPQEPGMEYQDAVRTLNTLQTNAGYLEQVKRQRRDPQTQLEAMKLFLARSGLQVEDLDQLNIIHVTGTKGKGSTCAFTESVLRSYGLKTGFFRTAAAASPCLPTSASSHSWPSTSSSKRRWTWQWWKWASVALTTAPTSSGSLWCVASLLLASTTPAFWGTQWRRSHGRKGASSSEASLPSRCSSLTVPWRCCGTVPSRSPVLSTCAHHWKPWRKGGRRWPWAWMESTSGSTPPWPCSWLAAGYSKRATRPLPLPCSSGLGELKVSRPSVLRQMPLAPVFQPTPHMRHGLRDTEWLGRTQVLRRGPLTWYLDGAHTASSVQACVRWFHQALLRGHRPGRGPEVRILLFNSTGDRDSAALLKLLQPCQFDYAVFCPNLTEVSSAGNADQQNFMVTLDQVLLRCLAHQQYWSHLAEAQASPDPWSAPSPEPGEPTSSLLASHPPRTHSTSSLVFSCISHALQWISQGRDPVFQPPSPPQGLLAHPVAGSGAGVLREAAAIHVLVTGSLHLVGGVLKLLEPALSQ
ncbi:folylpolyglutamate synthase, mitochondrial isoform X3 [Mirounga angustirostris]|uniref:folylpolyglutamate synthase, mitochondrial isoform X3 n=1 Tax=Mirounga angustirostris TaxID=9716 RepID=UPI00313DA277